MISYKINVEEDERIVKVSFSTRSFYLILGLMFLVFQVTMMRFFMIGFKNRQDLLMFVLIECFFIVVFYVIASWCPFYLYFVKDKKEKLLIFFAAPGCWRKKVYSLIGVSGLLVEDRGEYLGRLYLLGGERHIIFDSSIQVVSDLASKVGEAFNIPVYHD